MARKKIVVRLADAGEASKWCATHDNGEGAYLALSSFWGNKARYDGLQAHCRDCQKQYDKDNPEQFRRRKNKRADKLKPLRGYHGSEISGEIEKFRAGGEMDLPVDIEADKLLAEFLASEK